MKTLSAAGLLLLAAPAILPAQDTPPAGAPRVFQAASEGMVLVERSTTPLVFGFDDGGVRYLVEVSHGAVTATADARPVDPRRLQVATPRVDVLDERGAVMARITTTANGGTLQTFPHRHRVSLGLRLLPVPSGVAAAHGRDAADLRLVGAVVPELGAAKAGVQPGDLLFEVDGGPAREDRLRAVLAARKPGETTRIQVLRGGVARAFDVVLQAASPPEPVVPSRPPAIEFRDGMLLVFDSPEDRGAPAPNKPEAASSDVARQLAAMAQRLQELESLVRQLTEKVK